MKRSVGESTSVSDIGGMPKNIVQLCSAYMDDTPDFLHHPKLSTFSRLKPTVERYHHDLNIASCITMRMMIIKWRCPSRTLLHIPNQIQKWSSCHKVHAMWVKISPHCWGEYPWTIILSFTMVHHKSKMTEMLDFLQEEAMSQGRLGDSLCHTLPSNRPLGVARVQLSMVISHYLGIFL